jgi:hypothetical protein
MDDVFWKPFPETFQEHFTGEPGMAGCVSIFLWRWLSQHDDYIRIEMRWRTTDVAFMSTALDWKGRDFTFAHST